MARKPYSQNVGFGGNSCRKGSGGGAVGRFPARFRSSGSGRFAGGAGGACGCVDFGAASAGESRYGAGRTATAAVPADRQRRREQCRERLFEDAGHEFFRDVAERRVRRQHAVYDPAARRPVRVGRSAAGYADVRRDAAGTAVKLPAADGEQSRTDGRRGDDRRLRQYSG